MNALGSGPEQVAGALAAGDTSGMTLQSGWLPSHAARVGAVQAPLPPVPLHLARFDCRNNRLLLGALGQIQQAVANAIETFGPERIGIVLGTSTSGIAEGERAVAALEAGAALPNGFHYAQQEIGTVAPFLALYLGLSGPAYTVSTACTSSAKALAAARNLLRWNICDAVIAGGVDSLCKLTINGFAALESITEELSNPMSRNRRGINIGEAAALMLLTRERGPVALLGVGESSDAYHISAPDPQGKGAEAAMRAALAEAGLDPRAIGYVNLHATGTLKNDEMESFALTRVFPHRAACSGTKPLTGHTLGAAGATEAALCWLAIQGDGALPPHVWDGVQDPRLPRLALVASGDRFPSDGRRLCMSNSFAFGGSNVCLVLGEAQ